MGRGAAAELILGSAEVSYVGVDRSPTAVAATRQRLAHQIGRGAAEVLHRALSDLVPERLEPFHTVLAVNVNVFWTTDARVELSLLRRLLSPAGGCLELFYETPSLVQHQRIRERTELHLHDAGFLTAVESQTDQPRMLRVTGSPSGQVTAGGRGG